MKQPGILSVILIILIADLSIDIFPVPLNLCFNGAQKFFDDISVQVAQSFLREKIADRTFILSEFNRKNK